MQRAAFVRRIKPDRVDEHAGAHRAVWPEMLEESSASVIRNFTIFLHETSASGYLESNLEASWAYLAAQDVSRRWQDAMADLPDARVNNEGPAMPGEIFRPH